MLKANISSYIIYIMITRKRINREDVAPVHFIDEVKDKRPVAGADIFPEIYSNIFFCARKKSGKTCAIAHIIEKCATTETKIIAFVSTLHRDSTWKAIQHSCKKRGIDFTGFTSLTDETTKENILLTIVNSLQQQLDAGPEEKEEQTGGGVWGDDTLPKGKRIKKPKENACKIMFILDDLAGELDASVTTLLKKNRHFKCKVIISSQSWNDIQLAGRKQIDYLMLYAGFLQSKKKMEEIYENLELSVPFESFIQLYEYATRKKFCWLYIDKNNSTFRENFSHELNVPENGQPVTEEREL